MKTVIYVRVSTEDQVEKYGLPSQLRLCRDKAKANGYTVLEEVSDDGFSGATMDRPGLERVRQMVRDGLVDVVLMVDADRLSRELVHLLILKPEIEKRARLEFVASTFEDSPSGRMFFGVRGVIAQYERELTRERTMRGQRERARSGLLVGGRVAYGYTCEGGVLAVDAQRAEVVRDIYNWYDAGDSLRTVARRLREAGVPCYRAKRWWPTSIRCILGNETYAGVAHFGTRRNPDGKSKERIAVTVPSLVDRALWERTQRRLTHSPNTGRPSTRLMRGTLFCSCGRRMSGERAAYRCVGRDTLRATGERCIRQTSARQLDDCVWSAITKALTAETFLRTVINEHEEAVRNSDPKQVEKLKAAARKLKGREDAALSSMLDPDLADARATFKAAYKAAQSERASIEAKIAGIESARQAQAGQLEWIEQTVAALREYIPTIKTPEQKREFYKRVVSRVEWDGERAHIELFIGPILSSMPRRIEQLRHLQVTVTATLAA